MKIKSIKTLRHNGKVYDLSITGSKTYTVNDVSVHNSAAGSLVAHCLDITDVDPIKYDLIFERFIDINRGGYYYNNFKGHKEKPIDDLGKEW